MIYVDVKNFGLGHTKCDCVSKMLEKPLHMSIKLVK